MNRLLSTLLNAALIVGLSGAVVAQSFPGLIQSDRLLGRDTTGEGQIEQLTVGGGLGFTGSGGIGITDADLNALASPGTLPEETAPAPGDKFVAIIDGAYKTIDWDKLPEGGEGGTDDQTAAEVSFDPDGLEIITATNVQEALEQLDAAVDGIEGGGGSGDVTAANNISDGALVVGEGGAKGIKGHASGAPGTMAFEDSEDYVANSLFDANTILAANTDNTPAAVTVAEARIVGRATGGNIAALDASAVRTILGLATSDTVQFNQIELGHATQNTLTASGGELSIEGSQLLKSSTAASTYAPINNATMTGTFTVPATLNFTSQGSIVKSGNHALTLTTTGATNVTFPTSGTLLAGTIGIANDNILTAKNTPNSGEFAKFTSAGIEGRTASELRGDINVEDGADVTDAGNVGAAIHEASAKSTPHADDTLALIDTEASNVLKKIAISNLVTAVEGQVSISFTDLTDAPSSYGAGDAGKPVVVNAGEDGVEFGEFLDVALVPVEDSPGSSHHVLGTDGDDALVLIPWDELPAGGGGGAESFTDLDDVPSSYSGQGGKAVAVKDDMSGLEFVEFPEGGGGGEAGPKTEQLSVTFAGDAAEGVVVYQYVAYDAEIKEAVIYGNTSGDAVIDIWVDSAANFPPTDADSITDSSPPELDGAQVASDDTLSGWTTTIPAGSYIAYKLVSSEGLEWVKLDLVIEVDGAIVEGGEGGLAEVVDDASPTLGGNLEGGSGPFSIGTSGSPVADLFLETGGLIDIDGAGSIGKSGDHTLVLTTTGNTTVTLPTSGTLATTSQLPGAASTSAAGVCEIATAAEYRTGTDTGRCLGVAETVASAVPVALTSTSNSTAVDFAAGINFHHTALAENTTLANPTNEKPGFGGMFCFTASGGTRTVALHSDYTPEATVEAFPIEIESGDTACLPYWIQAANVIRINGVLRYP